MIRPSWVRPEALCPQPARRRTQSAAEKNSTAFTSSLRAAEKANPVNTKLSLSLTAVEKETDRSQALRVDDHIAGLVAPVHPALRICQMKPHSLSRAGSCERGKLVRFAVCAVPAFIHLSTRWAVAGFVEQKLQLHASRGLEFDFHLLRSAQRKLVERQITVQSPAARRFVTEQPCRVRLSPRTFVSLRVVAVNDHCVGHGLARFHFYSRRQLPRWHARRQEFAPRLFVEQHGKTVGATGQDRR